MRAERRGFTDRGSVPCKESKMEKGNLNAKKHGAFAELIILPGEDAEEFEALHNSLIDEWDPQGPVEDDRVLSLAQNLWRKLRCRRYNRDQIMKFEKKMRTMEAFEKKQIDGLINLLEQIESGEPPLSEKDLLTKLPKSWVAFFKKNVPRKKYDTDSDWLAAVAENISDPLEKWFVEHATTPTIEEELVDFNGRTFAKNLALEERIDAKIDKDIVSLGRMKTMQSMGLGRRRKEPASEDQSVEQIDSPPIQSEPPTDELPKVSDTP
jgi:hypothetical protein